MKSAVVIILAFLAGALVVAAGWGGAIYTALVVFGFISLIVFAALIWTFLDKQKRESQEHQDAANNKKDIP
jgi:uncharacterized PurR-regulated membrane protein YhhQ (DUF165 family)